MYTFNATCFTFYSVPIFLYISILRQSPTRFKSIARSSTACRICFFNLSLGRPTLFPPCTLRKFLLPLFLSWFDEGLSSSYHFLVEIIIVVFFTPFRFGTPSIVLRNHISIAIILPLFFSGILVFLWSLVFLLFLWMHLLEHFSEFR